MSNWNKVGKRLIITAGLWLSGQAAQATVSEYTGFFIPYEREQSAYVCLHKDIMSASFGIPLASMMTGIFSGTQTLHQGGTGNTYQNINLLVNGTTTIGWNLNFDRYNANGVTDYSFTLDMAAFNTLNGNSVSGRQKTKDLAKLAVVAILKTAESLHGAGQFRVWIKFNNLPSQSGLSGGPVYTGSTDWPGYPFTAGSSLYQSYTNAVIHPGC